MRFGGIVLAALLLVGACTGEPEPQEPPTTTSATPTIAVPTMPPEAKENTAEGAAAFVKHYIDVFNYASNTGDVTELSRLSSPDCEGCQSYIKLYKDTYEAGGYFKDSNWVLSDLIVENNAGRTVVFCTVTSDAGTFRRESNTTPEVGNAEDSKLTFIPLHRGEDWLMLTFELQAS